jgi:prolipoprotein diacylglyceryltransferase
MQPFIRIGGLTLASYGILMSVALFAGYYLFAAELRRRKIVTPSPLLIMAILAAGALMFSRLYFLICSPRLRHRSCGIRLGGRQILSGGGTHHQQHPGLCIRGGAR